MEVSNFHTLHTADDAAPLDHKQPQPLVGFHSSPYVHDARSHEPKKRLLPLFISLYVVVVSVVTSCSLTSGYRRFESIHRLDFWGISIETNHHIYKHLVLIYQPLLRYNLTVKVLSVSKLLTSNIHKSKKQSNLRSYGPQLVKKFPSVSKTRNFITVLRMVPLLFPFRDRAVHSTFPIPFLKIYFNTLLLLTPRAYKFYLSVRFKHQNHE